ncbi:MAG: hypothetical protein ACXQTY_02010 [Candidatus Methanogasteraceae archaeon]
MTARHKADATYPIVAAAFIIAKVRERSRGRDAKGGGRGNVQTEDRDAIISSGRVENARIRTLHVSTHENQ